jgi:phenylacetate-CoA ligase
VQRALSRKNVWEALPRPVKATAGALLSLVPLDMMLGPRFRRQLDFLREVDRWPAARVADYQEQELRQLCALAAGTPYYRGVFADAGIDPQRITLADLPRLPRLDRAAVRTRGADMCATATDSRGVDYVSTGGTSGEPLAFYINADRSPIEYAYLVAGWERAGYHVGMPLAVFRGRVVSPGSDQLRHEHDPLLRHHYFSTFHLTDENIGRYLDRVATIGDCMLHVYPSSAAALARYLTRARRQPPPNIRGILAESEIVYAHQRAFVESVFKCRYFSSYGMTEKVVAAAECEHSSAYHVWPTYGITEVVDDEGRVLTEPGQRGEIVATGFMNRVMPFIRYRTGDYATLAGSRCEACGRNQMLLTDIQGHRVQESLVASDGAAIVWTALNMHDDTFENVTRFQFFQERPGVARLRVMAANGFGPEDEARIQRNLGRKFDGRLAFTFELVDEIPLSRSGKTIYVDQRIPGLDS